MLTMGWYFGARVQTLGSVPADVHEAYMNGLADQSGSMAGPGGHLFRVNAYLVLTDESGNEYPMLAHAATIRGVVVASAEEEAQRALRKHDEYVATFGTYAGL